MSLVNLVLNFLIVLAAVGLCSSLIVHLVGFFNDSDRLNKIAAFFFIGAILISVPAFIIANLITVEYTREKFFQIVVINCPEWMQYETCFFFAYALCYFAVDILKAYFSPNKITVSEIDNFNEQVININFLSFSGVTMAWYSVSLAVFYVALQVYG